VKRPRQPSPSPPVYPPIAAILAERPSLTRMLLNRGVPSRDVDDVLQMVFLGAWKAIEVGRYRPDPRADPQRVLRAWLYGICWRQALHHVERACTRHEISMADPWARIKEPRIDPTDGIGGAEVFAALWTLPLWARQILLLAAVGHDVTELAKLIRISVSTATNRLRRARLLLANVMASGRG
jgi:RNA polymerase sigma-70 factor, ECF subfamily